MFVGEEWRIIDRKRRELLYKRRVLITRALTEQATQERVYSVKRRYNVGKRDGSSSISPSTS